MKALPSPIAAFRARMPTADTSASGDASVCSLALELKLEYTLNTDIRRTASASAGSSASFARVLVACTSRSRDSLRHSRQEQQQDARGCPQPAQNPEPP